MNPSPIIVGLGEALFDCFEDRKILGGAPLNVAVHAHQLVTGRGGHGVVVTRVGGDELGTRIKNELAGRGMPTGCVQTDPNHPTGTVHVTVVDGEPSYDIVEGVAWDRMQFDASAQQVAAECAAVCFGTLAQRHPLSQGTIHEFLSTAQDAIRLFDVNLRQDYYDDGVLRRSCRAATALKLNEHELPTVASMLKLTTALGTATTSDSARALLEAFELSAVALTRGKRGTALVTADGFFEDEPVSYDRVDGADSVGAGHACSAGLLYGMLQHWPAEKTLHLANHLGAYVASRAGATPKLPSALIAIAE